MSQEFSKYLERGAYHWTELSRNPFVGWPYTRSRIRWVVKQCLGAARVLEIGCGDGAILGRLSAAGADVTGVDSEPSALDQARQMFGERRLSGRFENRLEDLGDDCYEAVILAEVIEHIDEPEPLLELVKKHLTPGGRFVLTTPIRLLETSLDPHHVHEFWPTELETFLGKHFEDVRLGRMHPAWLIDLHCYALRGHRPLAWLDNLLSTLTGIELLDRLPSPLGIYWTQTAICERPKPTSG